MHYRREIDGLRTLAVLPVILFHAGFSFFSGGFTGVDIFFVISGFLITSIILEELSVGTFSVVNFYERRARRILPALFLMMAACLPFAWTWLQAGDSKEFSQSLIGVSSFSSNFLFWHLSGYFDTSAELKPLLHTWSLAVEEQYYVFFPLFLSLIWRWGRPVAFGSLCVLALLSLAAAQWGSVHMPSASFFLLPTRGWELLIGSLVAFHLTGPKSSTATPPMLNQWGSATGLALILYGILMFDRDTPFPGICALVPTLGTALIILFARPDTVVGSILGNNVLVRIGLLSYSAYLWHQPIFAFARHRASSILTEAQYLGLIVLTLNLAYISWRFVEAPFRQKARFDRKAIFQLSLLGIAFFTAVGTYGHLNDGLNHPSLSRYADIKP
jgi:peptidoglycan/LPS O-acetylase OafA/YrhL